MLIPVMYCMKKIQTKKIDKFPVVLVGKEYWSGLIDWITNTLMKNGLIGNDDLGILSIVDSPEEAVKEINDFYEKYLLKPNF